MIFAIVIIILSTNLNLNDLQKNAFFIFKAQISRNFIKSALSYIFYYKTSWLFSLVNFKDCKREYVIRNSECDLIALVLPNWCFFSLKQTTFICIVFISVSLLVFFILIFLCNLYIYSIYFCICKAPNKSSYKTFRLACNIFCHFVNFFINLNSLCKLLSCTA